MRDFQIGEKFDTLELITYCSLGSKAGGTPCRGLFQDTLTSRGLCSSVNAPAMESLLAQKHLEMVQNVLASRDDIGFATLDHVR